MKNISDVTIIDYGLGNVKSVFNMFRKIGYSSNITNDPKDLKFAKRIVIPGVGSFDMALNSLKKMVFRIT